MTNAAHEPGEIELANFTRREAFVLSAAAAATLTTGAGLGPNAAMAQQAASPQAPSFYRSKIGDLTVTAIHDGFARRPLEGFVKNADIKDVEAAMRAAFLPTDALPIPFTTLVVQNGANLILLDTGNGDMGAPTSGLWMSNFRAAGFKPEDVTHVVISHFHGDHVNGLRLKDGSSPFANAQVHVPATEWAFWMSDENMMKAPETGRGGFQNARRVFTPIADKVVRYEAGKEIAPGLMAIAAPGHTPGHTAIGLTSAGKSLIFMADLTNHPALFVKNPDWSAVFDMNADEARATRRKMLDMAATERTQVAFYHAPFPATGFIAKDGNGFELVPVQWSTAL